MALDLGHPREAMDDFTKSIAYREEWLTKNPGNEAALREQAGAKSSLGHAYVNLGDPAEAEKQYQESLAVLSKLAQKDKPDVTDRTNVALCYNDLGTAELFAGNLPAARENCRLSAKQLEVLYIENHRSVFLLRKLVKSYYSLGTACQQLNDPETAHYLERSVTSGEHLFKRTDKERSARQVFMLALARDGQIAAAMTHLEHIENAAAQETDALYQVACTYALCAAARDRAKTARTSLRCLPPKPSVEKRSPRSGKP